MSTVKWLRAGVMAGILIGAALAAGPVRAQDSFSTERPSSVLIFPKVVNVGDGCGTIVQLTNTSNGMARSHCFYVNGRQVNGAATWQVTDFELDLTRQQPTHWCVGEGRAVNPFDDTEGLDPGLIPPVGEGFTGFLLCVQVSPSGEPLSGNALKGEATVGSEGGISKYNAIGIPGIDDNDGDNVLELNGMEYAACPRDLLVNFPAENGSDPAIDGASNIPSVVSSNLTLVPCGMDFENLIPGSTLLLVSIRNEFEEGSSVTSGLPVDCWFSQTLGAPVYGGQLTLGGLKTEFGTMVLRPPVGTPLVPGVGVLNTLRTAGNGSSDTAALNLFWAAGPTIDSEIRLPSPP